jgi:hypothetical protein
MKAACVDMLRITHIALKSQNGIELFLVEVLQEIIKAHTTYFTYLGADNIISKTPPCRRTRGFYLTSLPFNAII